MSVRREKPDSATETARVMRVFDMLVEELDRRYKGMPFVGTWNAGNETMENNRIPDILAIADRICARTEDPA